MTLRLPQWGPRRADLTRIYAFWLDLEFPGPTAMVWGPGDDRSTQQGMAPCLAGVSYALCFSTGSREPLIDPGRHGFCLFCSEVCASVCFMVREIPTNHKTKRVFPILCPSLQETWLYPVTDKHYCFCPYKTNISQLLPPPIIFPKTIFYLVSVSDVLSPSFLFNEQVSL